jgi:hypothetical protein
MSAALVLSFSGFLFWACAASWSNPGRFAVADCSCLVDHQRTAPLLRGRGLQPVSEPVCSDLTESLSARNESLRLQSKPCTAKAESGGNATNVGYAIADPRVLGRDDP